VLLDAARIELDDVIETEVAVVGAGPAGIVVALELAAAAKMRVILIESGGDSFDPDIQRLGATAGEDPPHAPMSLTTRRQIGGASNLWAGRCVPFDPIDFQPRAITNYARWPVAYEELRAYFGRACDWLVCGAPEFDAAEVPNLAGHSLIPGGPGGDVHAGALERWSLPTNFGRHYRSDLESARSLALFTGLTCTEVVCDVDSSRVTHLLCRTRRGGCVSVRARRYVLACGGLETTRLLFASNRERRRAIGDHSGHLGRWYMAHVESRIANVHFATPANQTICGYERDPRGVYVRRRFTFSPHYMVAHDLPNAALWLANPELGDATHESGILSLLYLVLLSPLGPRLVSEAIRLRQLETASPGTIRTHLTNIARDLVATTKFGVAFGYGRFASRGHKIPGAFVSSASNVYPLVYHGEHLPHYDSHVVPTRERDALGVPRLETHLRFEASDVQGVLDSHRHFDRYLRYHGLGRLEYLCDDPSAVIHGQLFGGYHQAGTTRMSERPEDGVVDVNLAVHGVDNLHVASSSTFVTASQANTTFMIVVFALRLADHLRDVAFEQAWGSSQ
jgi:hypothetical protein